MTEHMEEGWGFPLFSERVHYFIGGVSLCRQWNWEGRLKPSSDDQSPIACVMCLHEMVKRLRLQLSLVLEVATGITPLELPEYVQDLPEREL